MFLTGFAALLFFQHGERLLDVLVSFALGNPVQKTETLEYKEKQKTNKTKPTELKRLRYLHLVSIHKSAPECALRCPYAVFFLVFFFLLTFVFSSLDKNTVAKCAGSIDPIRIIIILIIIIIN